MRQLRTITLVLLCLALCGIATAAEEKVPGFSFNEEWKAQRDLLHRITVGLMRRCRKGVYLGISDLGEQGYEQRGPMMYLFQQILQRHEADGADGDSA